ncbi:dipeptide epimerase [Sulfurovum sp. bin170]|uniref:dipeptide epimerase n=1 Tax=Sulfurovum sp. bin170 TaxID=2695268 RepID=UPI0013DF3A82|nr:dipeptide epimerase [Sulfurovum sp. bin170]NEW60771.1 dipeptide epimerase [Sulfurovum sp. bin170]
MKIKKIETQIVKAPLKTPFKTALRTVTHLEDLVVTIHADKGLIGYGEGASTAVITGETLKSMRGAIEHIKPMLIGREVEDFNALLRTIEHSMIHNTTIKSALEMALYDLLAQSLKLPLYRLLGGSQTKFETDITISLNDIDTMIEDCQNAIELGYGILKIKVGESIAKDYDRIRTIAESFPDTTLRIDANQAWSPKESVRLLQKLENQGIVTELIEQPVKANDFRGMKYIKERTITPLLADESVFSAKQAIELLEMDACDLINIKLAKCGGISHALKIADIAELYDVKCMIGCMLEGPISVGGAVHVASARSNIITMLDLDGASLLATNPVEGGVLFNESEIVITESYGLGIRKIY